MSSDRETSTNLHETIVYVAAHQFYLRDPKQTWNGSYENDPWSDDGLGTAPGVVGVQTARAAGNAPVFVEILEQAPPDAPASYSKVTAATIELSDGHLKIEGEENDTSGPLLELQLRPGSWCVRVLYAALDTITYDDDDGAEHYTIQLWPGPPASAVTLRAWEPTDDPVTTYSGTSTNEELQQELASPDRHVSATALVDLARTGAVDIVGSCAMEHSSRAMRLLAVNALRLVKAKPELLKLKNDQDSSIRGNVADALERINED